MSGKNSKDVGKFLKMSRPKKPKIFHTDTWKLKSQHPISIKTQCSKLVWVTSKEYDHFAERNRPAK